MTGRLNINQTINDVALNATQTNSLASTVWLSGNQRDMGTLKVTHDEPVGDDSDAAAISVLVSGATTAARGLLIDTTSTNSGDLLNLRNNGSEKVVVDSSGETTVNAPVSINGNLTMGSTNIIKLRSLGGESGQLKATTGLGLQLAHASGGSPENALYITNSGAASQLNVKVKNASSSNVGTLTWRGVSRQWEIGNNIALNNVTNGVLFLDDNNVVSGGYTVDISGDTNLSAASPITLTGDEIGFDFSTSNAWTAPQTWSATCSFANTVQVGSKIEHLGDSNTYIEFEAQNDNLSITCGGVQMIDFQEDLQDVILVNPSGTNVDLKMHGQAQNNLINVDASRDTVTIGSTSAFGLVSIHGFSDESQLVIRGHSTQTRDTFVIENSSGTDQFTVNNSGDIMANGTTDFGGVEYTWPASDGSNGQQLTTNGSGTLSWTDQDGGGGGHGTAYLSVTINSVSGALSTPYNVFDSGDYATSYSTVHNCAASNFSYYDTSGAFQYDGSTTSAAIKVDANLYVRPVETNTVRVRIQRNGSDLHDYDYDLADSDAGTGGGCPDSKLLIPVKLIINMEPGDNIKVLANHTNVPGGCIGSQMHVREGTTMNIHQIA